MTLEITLIRNGCTAEEQEGRLIGVMDEPLSEDGRQNILNRKKNNLYPKVGRVYTGPLRRCRDTTSLIYGFPALVLKGQCPLDYGEMSGMKYVEMVEQEPFRQWAAADQVGSLAAGEQPYFSLAKGLREFRELTEEMGDLRITEAAIITHKAMISMILTRFRAPGNRYENWDIAYGGGCTVTYNPRLSVLKVKKTF
jgi:alpha-ribazole phosphatase